MFDTVACSMQHHRNPDTLAFLSLDCLPSRQSFSGEQSSCQGFAVIGEGPAMLTISVSVGDAIATVEFDAGHWAPDIANDMVRRAVEAAVMASRLHRADTEAQADE